MAATAIARHAPAPGDLTRILAAAATAASAARHALPSDSTGPGCHGDANVQSPGTADRPRRDVPTPPPHEQKPSAPHPNVDERPSPPHSP